VSSMGDVQSRAEREKAIYDQGLQRSAFEAAIGFANYGPGRERRDEFIRTAMRKVEGKRVLEIGSQAWEACIHRFGYQPAALTCINISEAELELGRAHAARCGRAVEFRQMDANRLEFPENTFDVIFGVAILHHLDYTTAIREIHRTLRPGGKLLFVEPLRANPVARIVRWLTPHARTPDELPLGLEEIALVNRNFRADHLYCELFSFAGAMISRPFFRNRINPITRTCDALDQALLRVAPRLGPYFRTVVLHGEKTGSAWVS
jgi:SAM-dependent methyltransferase